MAGRRPKPTQLKVITGNPGKRPLNTKEPKPAVKRLVPPAWLDPKARYAFQELEKILGEDMRVLTGADRMALELLCDVYSEYREARDVILRDGSTYEVETEQGSYVRPRPEVAIAADAWKRVKSMLTEFGLTPSSRTRIKMGKPEEQDLMDDFLNRNT